MIDRGAQIDEKSFAVAAEVSVEVAFAGAPEGASRGLMRATSASLASRGEICCAISPAVVPRGTSRIAPSGIVMCMVSMGTSTLTDGFEHGQDNVRVYLLVSRAPPP